MLPNPKWFIPAVVVMILLMMFAFAHAEVTASWYSVESLKREGSWAIYHGKMANGKMFSDSALTCASRMHSLGTHLVVKNIKNGKEVIVVVTDRIGKRFARTRIDLSKGAFEKIADLKEGLVKVSITEITD